MRNLLLAIACTAVLVVGIVAVVRIGVSRTQVTHDGLAQEGCKIVRAIEAFTTSQGRLPINLAELVPDFMAVIPPVSEYSEWELRSNPSGYTLSCHGWLSHCYVVYRHCADQPEHSFWEENWEGTRRRINVQEVKATIEQPVRGDPETRAADGAASGAPQP